MPTVKHEFVAEQIDAGLVALEHVEPEEQIDVLALHDCKGAAEDGVADGDLGRVDVAQDAGGPDALGDARVALVEQAHDAACFGARDGHDCCLRARVDEGFDRMAVDGRVDVEHRHAAVDCRGKKR